jgi:hypothetical protein
MNKLTFYAITVVLNIIYYLCKPAELFAHVFNLKEMTERIKNIPHWIVESFTDPAEIDYNNEEYIDYAFKKKAA